VTIKLPKLEEKKISESVEKLDFRTHVIVGGQNIFV
jgi:hypothetical protein